MLFKKRNIEIEKQMYRGGIRLKGKSVDMNRRLDCSLEEQLSRPIRVG